ncbi:hypothetical protein [Roseitranquillus sediminis]|uniref:hypothetical protein n=1 Tax=Roseitranquillus sediminis TaxID=2809051 RepID=UPI001D0C573C|nr:hypothetical protein [Roseitranquillus sediminis]MBM9595100.1 hypothetical protein [Roseitranquillus sediminis]
MIRDLALAAGLALVSASAGAQIACLPPEEPYPYEPPRDDPELRAIINEQYETYVLEVEDYINCLRDEADLASIQAREVVERWVRWFGEDAAVRLKQGDGGTAAGE